MSSKTKMPSPSQETKTVIALISAWWTDYRLQYLLNAAFLKKKLGYKEPLRADGDAKVLREDITNSPDPILGYIEGGDGAENFIKQIAQGTQGVVECDILNADTNCPDVLLNSMAACLSVSRNTMLERLFDKELYSSNIQSFSTEEGFLATIQRLMEVSKRVAQRLDRSASIVFRNVDRLLPACPTELDKLIDIANRGKIGDNRLSVFLQARCCDVGWYLRYKDTANVFRSYYIADTGNAAKLIQCQKGEYRKALLKFTREVSGENLQLINRAKGKSVKEIEQLTEEVTSEALVTLHEAIHENLGTRALILRVMEEPCIYVNGLPRDEASLATKLIRRGILCYDGHCLKLAMPVERLRKIGKLNGVLYK